MRRKTKHRRVPLGWKVDWADRLHRPVQPGDAASIKRLGTQPHKIFISKGEIFCSKAREADVIDKRRRWL